MKRQEMMKVSAQRMLAPDIYELILSGELTLDMRLPGQFLHIKVPQADLLLRRPISLTAIDQQQQTCTLIYRVEGVGTRALSQLQPGDLLDVMGPLGNGFDCSAVNEQDAVFLLGGGIGVPPLYQLARCLRQKGAKIYQLFGFATKELVYYEQEFQQLGDLRISTDDGSYGTKGHVGVLLEEMLQQVTPKAVYACGAKGMLKMVDEQFRDHPHAYLSLEARMACGMGACYACVCHLQDDPSHTKSRKVCDQGPVFPTGEVVL